MIALCRLCQVLYAFVRSLLEKMSAYVGHKVWYVVVPVCRHGCMHVHVEGVAEGFAILSGAAHVNYRTLLHSEMSTVLYVGPPSSSIPPIPPPHIPESDRVLHAHRMETTTNLALPARWSMILEERHFEDATIVQQ